MSDVQTIYYFPTDAQGNATGKPIAVSLNDDGSADISALPAALQDRLSRLGTPDEFHLEFLRPKDGGKFLLALVRNSNGYTNFSLSPDGKK